MPTFLKNLEFWGTLLDICGLIVLLAHDVPYLQPLLRKLPLVHRTDQLLRKLKAECVGLDIKVPAIFSPRPLSALSGSEARALLKLFPDWPPDRKSPQEISLTALVGTKARVAEFLEDPLILPALPNGPAAQTGALCKPIPLSLLLQRAETRLQHQLYGWGFFLMFMGSLLLLWSTVR